MAAPFGIQGQVLEVTVVGGYKLRDTEWISRQDPYVCLEYSTSRYRTKTCTDGGKNPTFNEKFTVNLIEGLREMIIQVWNSNTLSHDDFIGSGKVQLSKVLSQGYDDTAWTIQSKSGRYAGEIRLILHYGNANKPGYPGYPGAAPQYPAPSYPQYPTPAPSYPQYPTPAYPTGYAPPQPYPSYPSAPSYPTPPTSYPTPPSSHPPPASYPSPYPSPAGVYPPPPYPSPAQSAYPSYPPAPYPGTYPPPPY